MSLTGHAHHLNAGEKSIRLAFALYVILLVAVPLLALVHFGLSEGLRAFVTSATSPTARAALSLTVGTAILVGVVNVFIGTATAWVLVRYTFFGRQLIGALVDLPLAVPTLVSGIMLAILYGPQSLLGSALHGFGIDIVFARPGIVLALLFVTLPFVVRAVDHLLCEIDPAEEEAAITLGAGPVRIFRTVFVPAIWPAAVSGGIRSVGRALGEFGSIVVIAGNIPGKTLTAPVFIFGEIESGAPRVAASVSILLLAFALALHGMASVLERRMGTPRAAS